MHGIAWPTVQRMMIDAPTGESGKEEVVEMELTDENGDEVLNYINSLM